MNKIFWMLLAGCLWCSSLCAVPVFSSISFPATVGKYHKFEVDFGLNPYLNPYDFDEIDIWAEFIAPSGKTATVYGFYYEGWTKLDDGAYTSDEVLAPTGQQSWKIRFSPDEPGDWTFRLYGRDNSGSAIAPDTGMFVFAVTPSTEKGFISCANNRYLKYDSGEPFIPIGDSYPWWLVSPWRAEANGKEKGTNIARHYMDGMQANGFTYNRFEANFFEGLNLVGRDYVLQQSFFSRYNQHDAWQLDTIMTYAKEKGINTNLALFASVTLHDMGSFWYLNPNTQSWVYIPDTNSQGDMVLGHSFGNWSVFNTYNANQDLRFRPAFPDSSGPCKNRFEFHTHPEAIAAQKKLFRYIVARWGYCTNLMSFELIDETGPATNNADNDLNPNYVPLPPRWNESLALWHSTMADYLRQVDPHHHLVTTGQGEATFAEYIHSAMDFVNVHWYTDYRHDSIAGLHQPFEFTIADHLQEWTTKYDKPAGIFEVGWCAAQVCQDPRNYELHNLIWSALFNGSMGLTAIWAHEVEVLGTGSLGQFAGVGAFSRLLPLLSEKDVPTRINEHGLKWQFLHNHLSDEFHGWVQDAHYTYYALQYGPYRNYIATWGSADRPPFASPNHTGKLPVSRAGTYEVTWYNTITGAFHSSARMISQDDSITLVVPLELCQTTWADAGFMVKFIEGAPSVQVWPNPSNGTFHVQLKHDVSIHQCSYRLYSATGALLMQEDLAIDPENPAITIDLKNFAAGVYLLSAQFEGANIVHRLLKQ